MKHLAFLTLFGSELSCIWP